MYQYQTLGSGGCTISQGEVVYHYKDDATEHAVDLSCFVDKYREFILKWWGERCPDFEEHCELCKQWQAFDTLTRPIDEA